MTNADQFSSRRRSVAILLAAILFLAGMGATSAWMLHPYANPGDSIALSPGSTTRVPGTAAPINMPPIGAVVRNPEGNGIHNARVRLNWTDTTRPKGQTNQ